jgi:hypothetical protein
MFLHPLFSTMLDVGSTCPQTRNFRSSVLYQNQKDLNQAYPNADGGALFPTPLG